MKNGQSVAAFEKAFAEYVGARYAIALCNGTATLHTALVALGVKPGDRVAVPPLTMSATTIAVLQAGATPVFVDVDPDTWLMSPAGGIPEGSRWFMPVSLYGLHSHWGGMGVVDDAAQTLRRFDGGTDFVSYSFQASKILPLGEGGMLVTNDEELATKARSFSSLGYNLDPKSPRIDPSVIKSPDYERHHLPVSWNYRMNDITAERGMEMLAVSKDMAPLRTIDLLKAERQHHAFHYEEAILGCDWITPQYVPEGWTHDYWCYAVAVKTETLREELTEAIVRHGGERPYGAWRLTFNERPFTDLYPLGGCPVAEDLQPRLLQFQCNDLRSAEKNADALAKAIKEIGG